MSLASRERFRSASLPFAQAVLEASEPSRPPQCVAPLPDWPPTACPGYERTCPCRENCRPRAALAVSERLPLDHAADVPGGDRSDHRGDGTAGDRGIARRG